MIDLSVSIEFDTEKEEILNYTTTLNGIQEKKTSTTKKSSSKKNKLEGCTLKREENKIILSSELVEALGANPEDKISIQYERDENKLVFPVIGLSTSFENGDGNKLTKSNTVSYRGKANATLAEFGETFEAVPYKEGILKLKGDNKVSKDVELKQAIKKVDMGIDVITDETTEIEDLNFNF